MLVGLPQRLGPTFRAGLIARGLDTELCPDSKSAKSQVVRGGVDLVVVSVAGSAADSLSAVESSGQSVAVSELLRSASDLKPRLPVIVLAPGSSEQDRVRWMRTGASDCILESVEPGALADVVQRLATDRERPTGRSTAQALTNMGDFLIATPAMQKVLDDVRRVAPLDSTVLLTGETGTGKTRLARLIHELSNRANRPFVTVNCGALSATLIESEMFGHRRGAFTGADRDHVGKFSQSADGTILLDEIDTLSPALQAKLLRVVEERAFEPVGSTQTLELQARLIVATNRGLDELVAKKRFRSDLYYRLNVVSFELPPLRDRPAVIRHLASAFLEGFSSKSGRRAEGLDVGALAAMEAYSWPGNIRELRNVIERAYALAPGPLIMAADLPPAIGECGLGTASRLAKFLGRIAIDENNLPAALATESGELAKARHAAEERHIVEALLRNNNNRSLAALELGISRMTLYKKLHKYGLV